MYKDEIDTVMHERIEKYNQNLMSQDIDKIPIGLFCGKIGISIYFFHQAQLYNEKKYNRFAKRLLDSTFNQINTKSIISMEDGLIGVSLGLNYLVEQKFLSGDVNYVLSDLDDKIYQVAYFNMMKNISTSEEIIKSVFEVALYFCIRLSNKKLSKRNRFLYELIIIKAINQLEDSFYYSDKLSEPNLFSINDYFLPNYLYLLSLVQKLGFYNYKVVKIIDEISSKVLSLNPILQSSKLQLTGAMRQILNSNPIKSWDKHIQLLIHDMRYDHLIKNEFRNKNLLLANGLCGLFLIQSKLFENESMYSSILLDKIVNSEIWDDIYQDEIKLKAKIGLFTGLGGIILIYQELLKSKSNKSLSEYKNI